MIVVENFNQVCMYVSVGVVFSKIERVLDWEMGSVVRSEHGTLK